MQISYTCSYSRYNKLSWCTVHVSYLQGHNNDHPKCSQSDGRFTQVVHTSMSVSSEVDCQMTPNSHQLCIIHQSSLYQAYRHFGNAVRQILTINGKKKSFHITFRPNKPISSNSRILCIVHFCSPWHAESNESRNKKIVIIFNELEPPEQRKNNHARAAWWNVKMHYALNQYAR